MELRLRNYTERDQNEDKPFTSKELRAAFQIGAERFGWSHRTPAPRSMREGRELIGWGMAAGVWEACRWRRARASMLSADGKLEVASAAADIGTGTYTILAQIAADTLGVPMERVTVKLGDSSCPRRRWRAGPGRRPRRRGGAARLPTVRQKLFPRRAGSTVRRWRTPISTAWCSTTGGSCGAAIRRAPCHRGRDARGQADRIERGEAAPNSAMKRICGSYTHSRRVRRGAGRRGARRGTRDARGGCGCRRADPQPKTARSQVIGGVVFGIGMALHEEAMIDHKLGRFMNHNFAEYHVPVNADIPDIEVIFVDEHDDKTSPIGVKGLGEIGIVGTAAAVANAIFTRPASACATCRSRSTRYWPRREPPL